ncbi:MAG: hypothetical protein WC792_01480 [Candidatus Micrarchaeia archaeon]|jgi:hypothetical protein
MKTKEISRPKGMKLGAERTNKFLPQTQTTIGAKQLFIGCYGGHRQSN